MGPKAIVSSVGNGQTIQFTGRQQFSSSFTTHDLVAFEGASFTMGYTGGPPLLTSQFPLGDPSLGCGATCVAFGSNGTLDWTFNILTYSAATSIHAADQLYMTGQGILTMTGHDRR